MKNHAFTLIELLVVVLIIGILAAIALPQYEKAVAKSRIIQMFVLGRAICVAQESYFLGNGTYTDDLSKLDINFSDDVISQYNIGLYLNDTNAWAHMSIQVNGKGIGWDFVYKDKKAYCIAQNSNELGKSICKSITGVDPDLTRDVGFSDYEMSFL